MRLALAIGEDHFAGPSTPLAPRAPFMPLKKLLFSVLSLLSIASIGISARAQTTPASAPLTVNIGFLRQKHSKGTISILDIPAADDGLAGAKLAADDNNTTGTFLNQVFTLNDARLNEGDDPVAALNALIAKGDKLIIANLAAPDLLKVADAAKGKDVLIFNTSAEEDSAREQDCRANVIHTAPSYSMLADGLAEYLIWKQWPRWLLIKGSHLEDELFAAALERAAKKFGATIVDERVYKDTGGGRRSDSGSVQTQKLVPVLTQNAPAYDVLVAADESNVFAAYLPFRTWDPHPVAGSAGLVPSSWDPTHEQWGAIQLQNRFMALAHRRMNDRDFNAWTAMRMIGEAASHIQSGDAQRLRDFFVSPAFSIAAFKGEKETVRPWNQEVRQPILLGDGRTIVSVSPQEGFLHETSDLDTLGFDRPETKCVFH